MSKGKRFLKSSTCFLAGVSVFNATYCGSVRAIYEEEKEEALKKLNFLKMAFNFAKEVDSKKENIPGLKEFPDYVSVNKDNIEHFAQVLRCF